MADVILYNYFRSSTSYRARIALYTKNVPFEYRPVHLLQDGGQQHKPEYLQLNPAAEVPTLIHGTKVLGQSLPIIEYINEVFEGPDLFPKDPYQKAKVRQFCENINSFIHPISNLKVLQYLEKKHGYSQEEKENWVQHWSQRGLETLEKSVETNSTYCFGEQITAADIFLVPQLFSAQRFKVNVSKYSRLLKINERCLKLIPFQKAHPFRQPDTPDADRIQ